jgi:adenylate cyclase
VGAEKSGAKLDADFASAGQEWRSPPALLTRASRGLGHVVIAQESGVLRRVRLWQSTPRGPVPCMGLALAALSSGQTPEQFAAGKPWRLREGSAVVDWLGGREVFEQLNNSIDYDQVLDVEPEEFRDKIVLVGEVSRQSKEIALTPWGEIPALQAHATVAAMLLSPQGPPAPLSSGWTLALCLLSAGLVLAPLWRLGLGLAGCFAMLLAQFALSLFGGAWLFSAHHTLLPASAPLAAALFACNLLSLYEYRRARHALGRLIGIGMISRALHPLATLEPGEGESRQEEATAFFCDLRGYSTLSEELLPHETSRLVNAYFTFLVQSVHRWGGRVIDYQGDAIFVVFEALPEKSRRSSTWGEPSEAAKHATRAVRAALDITGGMREFSAAWEPVVGRELSVGIGLQSGPMQIGLIGSNDRAHFGAVGDTVNVAARIQGFSKTLSVSIVLGQGTHQALVTEGSLPLFESTAIEFVGFGSQPIRGRSGAVHLWGVRHSEAA